MVGSIGKRDREKGAVVVWPGNSLDIGDSSNVHDEIGGTNTGPHTWPSEKKRPTLLSVPTVSSA